MAGKDVIEKCQIDDNKLKNDNIQTIKDLQDRYTKTGSQKNILVVAKAALRKLFEKKSNNNSNNSNSQNINNFDSMNNYNKMNQNQPLLNNLKNNNNSNNNDNHKLMKNNNNDQKMKSSINHFNLSNNMDQNSYQPFNPVKKIVPKMDDCKNDSNNISIVSQNVSSNNTHSMKKNDNLSLLGIGPAAYHPPPPFTFDSSFNKLTKKQKNNNNNVPSNFNKFSSAVPQSVFYFLYFYFYFLFLFLL